MIIIPTSVRNRGDIVDIQFYSAESKQSCCIVRRAAWAVNLFIMQILSFYSISGTSLERLCWCLYSLFKKWSVLCKLCILWLTGRGEQVIHRLIPVLCAQFKSFVRLLISRRYAASSMAVRWHSPAYPQDHARQKWISHWAYSARVAENTLVLVYNSVFSDLSQLTRLMCISLWLKNKQHSVSPVQSSC